MIRLLAACALAAALVLAVSGTAGARLADEAKPAVFTDPTGDSGSAADVTSVSVTNDETGLYHFEAGFATPLVSTSEFDFYLNTDKNTSTGDTHSAGADYVLSDYESDKTWTLWKWNGSDWADAPTSSTVKVNVASDLKTLDFSINKSDIDNTTSFDFFVASYEGDGSDGHYDDGPSGEGTWAYDFQVPLSLSLVTGKAFAVKAGGVWSLVLVARRSDTGETVGGEGTLACSAGTGSTKLAIVTRAFVSAGSGGGNGAVCSFRVPKKLKHKVLRGTITITLQGKSVTKAFTTTVK